MFEQASVGIAFASLDGQLLQCNERYCEIVGHPREKLIGRSFADITHPDDLALNWEYLRRLLEGERHTTPMEKRYIRKDGSIAWASLTLSLMHDAAGTPLEYMAVIADISERKRAETEAAAHASQLEATLEAMTDAVTVYDCDGHIMFASPTAQEVFLPTIQPNYYSLSVEEGSSQYSLYDEHGQPLPSSQWPAERILRGEVLKGAHSTEVVMRTADGHEIQLSVTGSPMRDVQGNITGGVLIARDVTERRRLERRTHEALVGLLSMAESLVQLSEQSDDLSNIGHRLTELTRNVLDCQRVAIQLVEPETELVRPLAVVGLSPEQEREWWEQQQRQVNSLKDSRMPELTAHMRSGEVLVLDMRQPAFRDMPNPYNITVMLVVPIHIQDRLVGILTLDYSDETHIYTIDEIALASAVAKLSGLVIERQRLLQERAAAQGRELALRTANIRMEEFLGIASHELRTPMTTIKANIQLAQRRLNLVLNKVETMPEDSIEKVKAAQDMLARAERQVGVLNRLVGDLIDMSRIQTGKLQLHLRQEPCDLVGIVREAVQEQRQATPGRTILLDVPTDTMVPAIVDPDRIVQVITNYMSNALKFSATDKPVEVRLEVEQEAEGEEKRQVARVSVRDEGPGLSEHGKKHIWERFYQAEGVKVVSGSSVGLGLGLHISRTLIERHGGCVGVESTPGKGSTFWFILPLAEDREQSS
jgi:PAS domain S-box-containing protein